VHRVCNDHIWVDIKYPFISLCTPPNHILCTRFCVYIYLRKKKIFFFNSSWETENGCTECNDHIWVDTFLYQYLFFLFRHLSPNHIDCAPDFVFLHGKKKKFFFLLRVNGCTECATIIFGLIPFYLNFSSNHTLVHPFTVSPRRKKILFFLRK